MLHHYFLVARRNLWKHKAYSVVNLLGLALAMMTCLVIFLYVHYETHYDTFWPDPDRIYRVVHDRYQNDELNLRSAKAYMGMSLVLPEKVPEVAAATEALKDIVSVTYERNQIKDIPTFAVEENFTDVFALRFVDRKTERPLTDLHSSVISESAARRLFGTPNAVGKWFTVNEGWEFEVTGVFRDLPPNTHMAYDLLISRKTYRYYAQYKNRAPKRGEKADFDKHRAPREVTSWDLGSGHYNYVRLRPRTDPRQVEQKINAVKADYLRKVTKDGTRIEFHLQPMRDIHLHSHRTSEIAANGDPKAVLATAALGAIIMLIAWINFINLTLARSLERAKEVAIRKVVGASRRDLIVQHLIEYGLVNVAATILAVAAIALLQPYVWQLLERQPDFGALFMEPGFVATGLAVVVAGILAAGFYPALIQSSYAPVLLFKPRHKLRATWLDPRRLLVVGQFTASIVLFIGVITIYRQIEFMRRQALGFHLEQTLITYSPMSDIGSSKRLTSLETFRARVLAVPGVEAMATASFIPGREILSQRQDVRKASDPPNTKRNYDYLNVDHAFVPTFKLALRAGRNFSDKIEAEAASVLINESAMQQLGYSDPAAAVDAFIWIGDKQFKIVGVLQNYHQETLKKQIRPIVYFCGYKWMFEVGYYALRLSTRDLRATVQALRQAWEQTYPVDPFEYQFLDDAFDRQYREDRRFGTLFALFTGLAVVVACLGLQGLATYAIQKRTKEIGIRKVNGASPTQIVLLLVRDFASLVGLAFVIACPVAYLLMEDWLHTFAYRTELSWATFAMAGMLALAIAIGATLFQAYRAATQNPVAALRYE